MIISHDSMTGLVNSFVDFCMASLNTVAFILGVEWVWESKIVSFTCLIVLAAPEGSLDFSMHDLSFFIRVAWLPYMTVLALIQEGKSGSCQFNSVAVVSNSLRPHNHSTPGLPIHHELPEFTQTHVHRVGDAIQPSHPLSSPSSPAPSPSQHQSLFQWLSSSHEVAKVLEFQL